MTQNLQDDATGGPTQFLGQIRAYKPAQALMTCMQTGLASTSRPGRPVKLHWPLHIRHDPMLIGTVLNVLRQLGIIHQSSKSTDWIGAVQFNSKMRLQDIPGTPTPDELWGVLSGFRYALIGSDRPAPLLANLLVHLAETDPLPSTHPDGYLRVTENCSSEDLLLAGARARIVLESLNSELLSLLVGGGATSAKRLAAELGWNAALATLVLRILCRANLISEPRVNTFRISHFATMYFSPESPTALSNFVCYHRRMSQLWTHLGDVLKTGNPFVSLEYLLAEDREFRDAYIGVTEDMGRFCSSRISVNRRFATVGKAKLLDVGAGSGVFATAIATQNPKLTISCLDLPEVVRSTKRALAHHPAKKSLRWIAADIKTYTPREKVDICWLSHIIHILDPEEVLGLFSRLHVALKRSSIGLIAIHDYLLEDEKDTSGLFFDLFTLSVRLYTRQGRNYTKKECTDMLRRAGFDVCDFEHHVTPETSILWARPCS